MRLFAWIAALVLASTAPASAGPLAAAAAAIFAGITVKAVALFALRLFASVGLSLLQQRRARRGRNTAFGLQVTATTRGELESETTIVGLYATKGHLIYHNSHGPNNKYYQTVIELGGLPGATFSRLMVDGVYSELGTEEHPDYGFPVLAKRDLGVDYAWIKVYDGTQTGADPTLVAKYAEDPETPWTEAHIGHGIPYAILTMEVSSKVWPNGAPEQRYEENGIPFYDPRLDSTVGGTGLHRWDDPTTWGPTRNPIVKTYNILRGLSLHDGSIWGGEADAEDLPLWNWVPGMNACDVDVDGRPQYQSGYEIKFAEDTSGDVINELLAACNGQIAEFGGFWYIQVGAPDIAVAAITDDDLLVTDAATKDPFPELLEIFNRVTAKYVSPGALWNGVPLDQIRNPDWEAEDGIVRNFELDLPAVFNPGQAGQLAEDTLRDHRRWRRHAWPLPPDYAGLRPLNTVVVTSAWNDYDAKLFEVTEIVLDLHRLTIVTSLRERDPDDFEIDPAYEIPDRASILPRPIPTDAGLPFFDADARIVTNQAGTRAHAAVDVFWDASGIAETIKGIAIECQKRETEEEVWSGTVLDVERGAMTIQPVPPLTNLRVRAKALSDNRRGTWTAWIWVTTDDVRIQRADFAAGIEPVTIVEGTLPTVKLTEAIMFESKLYRWSGTAYVATVPAVDVTGQLTDAQIAALAAAKLTGQIQTPQIATGAVTDAKIAGLAASKVTGQLTNAQLAAIAAAKVTGQITGTQITDGAISTPKIAVGAVTASQIAADTITAAKIASGTITATEIASGTITSAKIAAGTIQGSNIAANTITASQIAASTITASEIATGAVTAVKIAAATITGDKIAGTTITGDKIAGNTITAAKIASGTVTAAEIAAGTITGDKISANTITSALIATAAINAGQIATNAITTAKINGRAVTEPSTFFENYGGGTKTPATATAWNNATSFIVNVPDSGSLLMIDCHVNWLLNGGPTAGSWGLRLLLSGSPFDSQGGAHFQELVPFRRTISVGTGNQTITLECQRGSGVPFLIQNVHSVATILKR
ncbi:MAG: hypothetical protein VR71_10555 [Roseovarius sp. BRH_c41]|uniref:phage tail protein n=1 Tax=Roseovarius sp. BRH_c41 TaxID=1629709 RepID=UPI0005F129E0|nr:phage tail protein [Roseovarius sp. BRH_c41]KJS43350.1 MAG: hypothetical protein VR71_10555 [Roseovarius sp. BRH_c41]